VENATITVGANELEIAAPKSYALYLKDRGFAEAVRAVFGRPLGIKMTLAESVEPGAPLAAQPAAEREDEVTQRALANPEVRRFRELFGGEIRRVRNLKE